MSLRRITTAKTAFQEVEVWKSAKVCEFRVAGAVHAWWHRDRYLTGLAWDNLAAASLLRPDGPPRSLLMMGLAGGTTMRILRHLLPECTFTAVDIDGEVVELARKHMHLDDCGVEIHIADAYKWKPKAKQKFDVIIDDCYLAGADDVFRPVGNPENSLEKISRWLAPGGLLLANLVTGSGHRRMQSKTRAAFKRRFEVVRSITTPESMNETLAAGNQVLPGGKLDEWRKAFKSKKDKAYWDCIDVQKLK